MGTVPAACDCPNGLGGSRSILRCFTADSPPDAGGAERLPSALQCAGVRGAPRGVKSPPVRSCYIGLRVAVHLVPISHQEGLFQFLPAPNLSDYCGIAPEIFFFSRADVDFEISTLVTGSVRVSPQ